MKYPTFTGSKKRQGLMAGTFIVFLLTISILTYGSVKDFVRGQAQGQTLEVSPPSQEVTIDPGRTMTVTAKVTNKSNTSLPIIVHIEDFTASGDEGQVALSSGSSYSVTSWTKISPSTFSLAPGETQAVTATITAPKDAAGGRYGSFVFAVKPDATTGNAAAVSQQIASLFLLRVNGPVNERLALTSMSAPKFQEFGPVPISLRFENSGNVHVKAYGLINVTDVLGHKVADIVVPSTNIFPGAARIVQAQLNKTFLIGPYTATAIIYYGSQNDVLNAQTTFYVFPVRIAAIIIVVLVILFLLRKRFRNAFRAMTK